MMANIIYELIPNLKGNWLSYKANFKFTFLKYLFCLLFNYTGHFMRTCTISRISCFHIIADYLKVVNVKGHKRSL